MKEASKKVPIALSLLAIYSTVYTLLAYRMVASSLFLDEGGTLWWRTSGPGAWFPMPRPSGMLQVLHPTSALDRVMYAVIGYHIPSSIAILLWASLLVIILRRGGPKIER